jgi:hypothetical protein
VSERLRRVWEKVRERLPRRGRAVTLRLRPSGFLNPDDPEDWELMEFWESEVIDELLDEEEDELL